MTRTGAPVRVPPFVLGSTVIAKGDASGRYGVARLATRQRTKARLSIATMMAAEPLRSGWRELLAAPGV